MSASYAIGIDVGTGSVKVSLIGTDGTHEVVRSPGYPTYRPASGFREQDPDDWWRAAGHALGVLLERQPGVNADNSVIGLTGQMHTTVLRGDDGRLIRPAILWSDSRAEQVCADSDTARMLALTSNPLLPAFTLAHLMWLDQNEPASIRAARYILQPKDDLRRRLGAGVATEPSDASATALMNTHTDEWDPYLMSQANITADQLPTIVASAAVTGLVEALPPGPDQLARLQGAPVTAGAGDQAALAVALEVTVAGRLGLSLGTSGAAVAAVGEPYPGTFRHAFPQTWLALDSMHSAGLALTWWAQVTGVSVQELVDELLDPDRSLPVFLPFLQGHRSHPGPPGAFVDLEAHHDRAALTQSILDGTCLEMTRIAGALVQGAVPPEVYLGGGGGRSLAWRQTLAAALDRPLRYTDHDSAHGAAFIAARHTTWWPDLQHAPDTGAITRPDPAQVNRLKLLNDRFAEVAAQLT